MGACPGNVERQAARGRAVAQLTAPAGPPPMPPTISGVRFSATDADLSTWRRQHQWVLKGHLARQGPGVLRWVLYEAAMSSTKKASPDHELLLLASRASRDTTSRPRCRCRQEAGALVPPRPSCGWRRRLGRGRLNGACSRARPARNHNDDLRSAPVTRMLARFSHPGQPPKNERPQLLRVGITPSTIMSPESAACTEVSLGVRTRVQAWKPRRPK